MSKSATRRRSGLSTWQIVAEYYKHCGSARRLIPLQLFLVFVDAFFQASIPALTGYVIDQLRVDAQAFVRTQLPWLVLGVLVAAVLFYAVAYTQHYLAQRIGNGAGVSFQVGLYNHLQRLGADFYQRNHVGEITSRLTNDINQGVMPLYTQFMATTWAISMVIVSCFWVAMHSIQLLAVFVVVGAVMIVISRTMKTRIQRLNREVRDESGRINARITEDVSANALIRAFAQEQAFSENIRRHSAVFLTKVLRTARLTTLFSDVMNAFLSILAPGALLLVGAFLVGSSITIGALVTAVQGWQKVAGPLSMILNNLNVFYAALASMDRIFEFFHETPLVQDGPGAKPLRVEAGGVALEGVTFHYPGDEGSVVLRDLSLRVPARTSVALVGESGAGKSTITQLMLRFYDPQQGRITIDGQDIRQVTQESLRRQIGFVMQETILLSGSIRDNLLFAKPGASTKEMINALKQAEAWEFVKQLPQGLDTMLGERGARLSGGQKQRLSIARVFLKNPAIVVFDEATSALDTITEKQIQQTMQKLFKDRTAVIIAHRLSTIVDCDTIVLLDQGRIIGSGPHDQLLDTCPRYRELCRKQTISVGEEALTAPGETG
jgi:ABC-type multidrug transport system fused ATPase/permease subunit